jgi:hypothetical protein
MTTSFKPLLVSFLLLMLVPAGRAQESRSAEKALKLHSQLLQTTSMVREIAAQAPLWDNKVAAVQVLADAADLLWDENPSQATRWLRKAWELIEQVSAAPRDEKLKAFFTRSQQPELRTLVLSVARKHDAEWADQLLKQLATQAPDDKHDRGAFDDRTARSEQLLQMAQQVIAANPELSFSLAESSLVDGVSYSLQNILTTLRRNNIRLANQLFDAALARFRSASPEASEAEVLAGYLFQSGFTFSTNSGGQTMLVLNPAQQNLPTVAASEPQRAREFLTAVYQLLLVRPVVLNSPEGKLRAQQILALGTRLSGPYP